YDIRNLKLQPELPEELQPKYYLSGSSDMARATAKRLDATLIEYPEPPADYLKKSRTVSGVSGIRIGIMARPTHDEAWNDAYTRFPKVRFGELMHQMAARTSDSVWHKSLAGQNGYDYSDKSVYWLGPFKQYHTFCPYLVGDYDEVARELTGYIQSGCKTCIIDIPISEVDLKSTIKVFDQALNLVEKV
ncbi:MAG: hypothetical protein LAT57_02795, partial [Balneolales bacterium]|nr:hypothetical protein [Balneolales bacterium]